MSVEAVSGKRSLYDRFLDVLAFVCMIISGVSLVILTVIFGWLVYGRYVLNATPTWVEQVSLLLIVLIAFLGASVGIHRNTHLGVSFFREVSSRPVKRVFELLSHITLIVFGAAMAVNGYKLAVFKWSTLIPLIHVPEGLRAVPIMLCGGLTLLFSIGHLIHFFKGEEEVSDITK